MQMPANKDQPVQFMQRAIALGRKGAGAGDGGPFGAVIVKNGEVIGEGWNQVVAGNDPTAHGEIVAIRDACKRLGDFSLQGSEIYTSGQPCPMCLAAIYWAHIDRIYYGFSIEEAAKIGFDDRFIYEQFALPAAARKIPEFQLLEDEALAPLKLYAADPTRVKY